MPSLEIDAFIAHWSDASPSERSNSQRFLIELCDVLAVPRPDNTFAHGYAFEHPVTGPHRDGTTSQGRIDLYKRACFVLESKQFQEARAEASQLELAAQAAGVVAKRKSSQPVRGTDAWDDAMIKARGQAERYVRALPADEPNPPFLLVVDVGHTFELFADFSQAGKAYLPFPDPRSFRLRLADLADEKIRARLRLIWTDPAALDPARHSTDVTREVSAHLAELAKSLEQAGHEPEVVAQFLTRCLFCMFAEDVGLLPDRAFTELLASIPACGTGFAEVMGQLFREMNTGTGPGISVVLRKKLLHFNGGLFASNTALPMNGLQLGLLKEAARQNWGTVEPAIFGTLLERALNPAERHQLGAHFTPRAYVERLVLPTVIEPLRAGWANVRAAAITHARAGELKPARAAVNAFHVRLCNLRVLDPACGTGNFLYVALLQLKVLEGEVLDLAAQLGENFKLELETHTVDPHQFLGLEINPRAASIAELVLWIGYLQWHFRLHGKRTPPEPILRAFKNIECRDAVLAYDGEPRPVTWAMAAANPDLPGLPDGVREEVRRLRSLRGAHPHPNPLPEGEGTATMRPDKSKAADSNPALDTIPPLPAGEGRGEGEISDVITVWDRQSTKPDLVTGREVPDETRRVPLLAYMNPRPAAWPAADFIVGNPPFLGNKRMREDLGDGYAQTLRATYPEVPESADFVMYWWHKAAALVRAGGARRFGFITTNSLRQTFNRRVVQRHLAGSAGASPAVSGALAGNTGRAATSDAPERSAGARNATREGACAPLSLVFAIPDHPWVDTAEGAAVRIAMTVGVAGEHLGELLGVTDEQPQDDGSEKVTFSAQRGKISADLTVGANVSSAVPLKANGGVCFQGMNLVGEGFRVTPEEAAALGHTAKTPIAVIRRYQKGRELVQGGSSGFVIDASGFTAEELRAEWPTVYQHLLTTVKPERDLNRDPGRRAKWWLFGRSNEQLRKSLSGLPRYIATVETSKFKPFVFVEPDVVPDHKLYAITLDDPFFLGVLSSHSHQAWALAAGGRLGVGNDPTWTNATCFLPFPFPLCGEAERARIRALAEELDAHRKRVQAQHPGLTLTGMYNVLEKLRAAEAVARGALPHPAPLPLGEGTAAARSGRASALGGAPARDTVLPLPAGEGRGEGESTPADHREQASSASQTGAPPHVSAYSLTAKERLIHEQGLVSVLKQLHDELDAAVFAAYGWVRGGQPEITLTDAEILDRLVALNAERAAGEARGIIHWLRPEYQCPEAGKRKVESGKPKVQSTLALPESEPKRGQKPGAKQFGSRGTRPSGKEAWPRPLSDRVRAVEAALQGAGGPVTPEALAGQFLRAKPAAVDEILQTLVTLGRARCQDGKYSR